MAEFWRQALDHQVAFDESDEVGIEPYDNDVAPALIFVPVPEDKVCQRIYRGCYEKTG